MEFVASGQIREGMCVAEDVSDPQGRILIARGQRIGSHHIVRLRKFGIQSLFIDPKNGESVVKPDKSELRKQCEAVLSSSCVKLTQEFAAKRISLDGEAIRAAMDNLVESLMSAKSPLVTLLDVSTSSDRLLQHSVNVSVLATILAIDLKVPPPMIKDLATGMLFHDVGLIFLPEKMTQKTEPIQAEDIAHLGRHPHLGFEHLVRTDAVSTISANLVLRHHEYLNGSGYPQGVGADKLSILMKIASVAEAYDSMTSPRFGIPAVLPDAAVSYIISNVGTLFAREVVVALCHRVALYPNGTAVRLSTGECGLVAGTLPLSPTKPIVLIHIDNKGRSLKEPMIVDLTRETGRSIQRSATSLQQLQQAKDPPASAPIHPMLASLG